MDTWVAKLLSALAVVPLAGCGTTDAPGTIAFTCEEPQPYAGIADSGYVQCEGGFLHREQVAQCPSALPRPDVCSGDPAVMSDCASDADCAAQPNGRCELDGFGGGGCYCSYGCTTDADCGPGAVCLCGDVSGSCVSAACTSDADCGDGLCATYVSEPGCGGLAFACQSPLDACAADADCPQGEQCTLEGDHRVCVAPMCAIGRPFLVAGEERLAEPAARGDWGAAGARPLRDGLTDDDRAALAAHWTRAGLMEHASIAAFARFSLQLLSMGAPPSLLSESQAAMADETEHARTCFALASTYAGRDIGPGPLSLDGALGCGGAREIVVTAVREGCVGETVAAIEAAEAAAHAADPAVRRSLEKIAADETRHAELAWRFVAWAVALDPALRDAVELELRAAVAETRPSPDAPDAREEALLGHGVVGDARRREIRRRALRDVVAPCARALCGDPGRAQATAATAAA